MLVSKKNQHWCGNQCHAKKWKCKLQRGFIHQSYINWCWWSECFWSCRSSIIALLSSCDVRPPIRSFPLARSWILSSPQQALPASPHLLLLVIFGDLGNWFCFVQHGLPQLLYCCKHEYAICGMTNIYKYICMYVCAPFSSFNFELLLLQRFVFFIQFCVILEIGSHGNGDLTYATI